MNIEWFPDVSVDQRAWDKAKKRLGATASYSRIAQEAQKIKAEQISDRLNWHFIYAIISDLILMSLLAYGLVYAISKGSH